MFVEPADVEWSRGIEFFLDRDQLFAVACRADHLCAQQCILDGRRCLQRNGIEQFQISSRISRPGIGQRDDTNGSLPGAKRSADQGAQAPLLLRSSRIRRAVIHNLGNTAFSVSRRQT